jgi:hypothetical protein
VCVCMCVRAGHEAAANRDKGGGWSPAARLRERNEDVYVWSQN